MVATGLCELTAAIGGDLYVVDDDASVRRALDSLLRSVG